MSTELWALGTEKKEQDLSAHLHSAQCFLLLLFAFCFSLSTFICYRILMLKKDENGFKNDQKTIY